MYFDAVIDHNHKPIFNDTPENIKAFLQERTEEENTSVMVFEGRSMGWFTVTQYLER